jgi:dynein heavy chain, axonemal
LFNLIIANSEKEPDILKRVAILIAAITQTVFLNICRGLFNDHKRIFSFLVGATISQRAGIILPAEWNVFCRGAPISKDKPPVVPTGLGIADKIWKNMVSVAGVIPNFASIITGCKENTKDWESWIFSDEPFITPFPKTFKIELSLF